MRNTKKILSLDAEARGDAPWLVCCWEDCERQAVDLHKVMRHEHARGLPCSSPMAKHPWYTFCSNRHRELFAHSHISRGNLPTGSRGGIL